MNIRQIERLIRKSIKETQATGLPVRVGNYEGHNPAGFCALDCIARRFGFWAGPDAENQLGVSRAWLNSFVDGVDGNPYENYVPKGKGDPRAFRLGRKFRAEFIDVRYI